MANNVQFSKPSTLDKPADYSYVVEATGPNRLIFIAGQLGLDTENRLVGEPGDFRAQANKAVENLKLALADAGATLRDVVKIRSEEHTSELQSHRDLPSFPTRRSSDLGRRTRGFSRAGKQGR